MKVVSQTDNAVVKASLDANNNIRAADDLILRLQKAAGGAPDGRIAIPQLATVARLAQRLGVLIARPLLIGGQDADIRLWVRARPVSAGVELELSEWQEAPHAPVEDGEALRAAQISLAPEGVEWRTNADGIVMEWCAASSDAPLGKALPDLFTADTKESAALAAEMAASQAFFGLPLHRLSDNRGAYLSGFPLYDADGSFLGYRGRIAFDAQEENDPGAGADGAAEETFAMAEMPNFGKRLDLALRQPLGRIIANAETIREQSDGPLRVDYAGYAADIAEAGRHLLELVDDVADLQAIDRAGFQVAREDVDLADIARRAAGLLSMKAADRHIRIEVPDSSVQIHSIGEFRRVLQIVVNLLSNAIRYAPKETIVTLKAWTDAGRAYLSVEDQGEGIPAKDRKRVFEKFERLGRSDVAGSGLGLYISHRLATAMKGSIQIDDAPDHGARFTLSLPVE